MRTELVWLSLCTIGVLFAFGCASDADSAATPTATPLSASSPFATATVTPSADPVRDEEIERGAEAAGGQEPEELFTIAQRVWNQRLDTALAPSLCPAIAEVEIDDSYYKGPLIDTHLHIPPLLNSPPRAEELLEFDQASDRIDRGDRQNEVMPSLGENITMGEIACTLEREGTSKAFAFFPAFPQVSRYLLEVVDRTMREYPAHFVPFINPPGAVEGVPSVEAGTLREMLSVYSGLFWGMARLG